MCRRVFAFVIGLAAAACGREGSPAPSQPLRLLAAENQLLPLSVRPPGAVHALRLVAGTLRALGRDTLVVSGEFEVGDSLSSRAKRSDPGHVRLRAPWYAPRHADRRAVASSLGRTHTRRQL